MQASILDAALAQSEELTELMEGALAEASDPEESREFKEEIMRRRSNRETLRELAGPQKKAGIEL